MKFTVIIPARYASTRLEAKMLQDIAGKPMIQHVYERAAKSGAARVIIATEDKRIEDAAKKFGAEVCLTSDKPRSGTERIAEVIEKLQIPDDEVIVNVQGDEPFIPSDCIHQTAMDLVAHPDAKISSLCEAIHDIEEVFTMHIVKVVLDHEGFALYFSRAPIPFDREGFAQKEKMFTKPNQYFRHIGIYAYRAGFVTDYVSMPITDIEQLESLEQLRALYYGARIHLAISEHHVPAGVDTIEDLERVREFVKTL